LFKLLKWSGLVAFILACLVAWVVKFAFLDSYILCQTMSGYMSVAPTTRLAVDLYTPLSNISSSFKELWNKGKEEAAQSGWSAAPAPAHNLNPAPVPAAAPAQGCFCGQCGAKNEPGATFCGSCGAKL
ncbi:MAG: zinc ribbon domain-containing protein, partial [Oscillospiraceae bacterium]|nr:zinc ribbon domain-containing protein [Oscillospiraceae bacterium]